MLNTQTAMGVFCGLFSLFFPIQTSKAESTLSSLTFTTLVIVPPSTSQNQGFG